MKRLSWCYEHFRQKAQIVVSGQCNVPESRVSEMRPGALAGRGMGAAPPFKIKPRQVQPNKSALSSRGLRFLWRSA